MLVVIPVSSSDSSLIPDFSGVLNHFGPYPSYPALVVCRPSDEPHAKALYDSISSTFSKVDLYVLPQDGPVGWPQGPNFYWGSVCHYLQFEVGNKLPWLWMEMDSTPIRRGWLDEICTEYNMAKMPFLGVLETTRMIDSEGNPHENGKHLVGVAVYPPNICDFSTLCLYAPTMPTPFDVLCQWEIVPNSHNSSLFQHGFRTQNYKRNSNNLFQGEDHNNFPNNVRFDSEILPTTALFHGCDDGSLAREILTEKDLIISYKTPPPKINANVLVPRRKRARAAA